MVLAELCLFGFVFWLFCPFIINIYTFPYVIGRFLLVQWQHPSLLGVWQFFNHFLHSWHLCCSNEHLCPTSFMAIWVPVFPIGKAQALAERGSALYIGASGKSGLILNSPFKTRIIVHAFPRQRCFFWGIVFFFFFFLTWSPFSFFFFF